MLALSPLSLNTRIRQLRKELGLTQRAWAVKLQVNRVTLNRWEAGIVIPRFDQIQLMCKIGKVSLAYFDDENDVSNEG